MAITAWPPCAGWAQAILAVVVPEPAVAYQILAMNTEKGHNLREKALEVIRMARALADLDRREKDFALEFEEAALLTLGATYERQGRFAGGAYHPVLRRVDAFRSEALPKALEARQQLAERTAGARRKGEPGRGRPQRARLHQPVSQVVRRRPGEPAAFQREAHMSLDEALDKMLASARSSIPPKSRSATSPARAGRRATKPEP